MPLRLRSFATLLLLASLCVVPSCTAAAAVARGLRIAFSGRVEEPSGKPVRNAKMVLEGAPEAATVTDADGRFALVQLVPDLSALVNAPLRLSLRASHRGWNLCLTSGAAALVVELRRVEMEDGSARIEVRSNEAAAASAVAAALRGSGEATVALTGDFLRWIGNEDRSEPDLTVLEVVPLAAAAPAAAPPPARRAVPRVDSNPAPPGPPAPKAPPRGAPDAGLAPPTPAPVTAPEPAPVPSLKTAPTDTIRTAVAPPHRTVPAKRPRRTTRPADRQTASASDTTARAVIQVSVRPDPSAPPPDSAESGDAPELRVALGRAVSEPPAPAPRLKECGCPVKGTVEVRSDQPLPTSTWVVVSLADAPAFRDSVELFMGPPRPFDLGRVPCGTHRLVVQPRSTQRFTVLPPALNDFGCAADHLQQFRVVLKPR